MTVLISSSAEPQIQVQTQIYWTGASGQDWGWWVGSDGVGVGSDGVGMIHIQHHLSLSMQENKRVPT